MSGGTTEVHIDSDYLVSGTHRGADSATTLWAGDAYGNRIADLDSYGAKADLYIENTTESTNSLIASVAGDQITTDDDIAWNNGDTYKIYKTGTKNSQISTIWTDLSRGWKSDKDDLDRGWRPEDVDIDRDKPGRVFGPNQPGGLDGT